jgi:hypothetical protein
MAKTKISEYSSTPANNTDISNININEGCSPSGINNAIRTLMAQLKNWQGGTSGDTLPVASGGTGSTTASAARSALSAAASGANSDITSLSGLTTPLSVPQGGTGATLVSTSTVARASNISTIVTSANHGLSVNDVVNITGCTNTSFNVATATVLSVANPTTFTFSQASLSDVSVTSDTTGKVLDLSYANLTNNVTGTLPTTKGGTGLSSPAKNKLLVSNGSSALSTITPSTVGNVLKSTTGSTVNAADLVEGVEYTILTVGATATNWTSIGAAAATVGTVFTKNSTAATGDGTATENVWTSSFAGIVTTTSGSLPYYGIRMFGNFNAVTTNNLSGTYIRTAGSTTATVTINSHGLTTGDYVSLTFETRTGQAVNTTTLATAYVVTVTGTNTFTITTSTTVVITNDTVTMNRSTIRLSNNLSSIARCAAGIYIMNFTSALPDTNYAILGTGAAAIANANFLVMSEAATTAPAYVIKTTKALGLYVANSANTFTDPFSMNYTIVY